MKKITVAFLYNVRRKYPDPNDIRTQMEVDFDDPPTSKAMIRHLKTHGFNVIPIEANKKAYIKLHQNQKKIDIAFNYSEGLYGEDRESHLPAMLEMLKIPYTGSSPLTQCLVFNKAKAKQILTANGIPTPPFQVFQTGKESLDPSLLFPLFVKPTCHGSSAGIDNNSIVYDEKSLYRQVKYIIDNFNQPALVELYLDGREFSVPMLGNPPRILPIIEPDFSLLPPQYQPIDSFEVKWIHEVAIVDKGDSENEFHLKCPADIDIKLKKKIEDICLQAWNALGIKDFCRIDIRCDRENNPYILEVNSPAGLIPPEISKASYFPMAARMIGMDYQNLLKTIISSALKRYEKNHLQ
ncbi:D-alanine--D-alanine ligase [Patescibacteria group bacterium]|nr:D-alanine--D-alanine ligase [Patescibacteria group bacterium]